MVSEKELMGKTPQWCPGCGHFGLLTALRKAIVELGYDPREVFLVSGIGCSGRIPYYLNVVGFHTLHGRPIPPATAAKLVNPKLKVIAVSGDGDAFAIGMGHFIHGARRNVGITYIVLNNMIYGLTTGQFSPSSPPGLKTKTSPSGVLEGQIDGVKLALASGATFIARGFSGDVSGLVNILKMAMEHRGFSYVEVLSPCVTFNRVATYKWFREHMVDVSKVEGYDPTDESKVYEFISKLPWDKIPVGVIFVKEDKPLEEKMGVTPEKSPFTQDKSIEANKEIYEELISQFL